MLEIYNFEAIVKAINDELKNLKINKINKSITLNKDNVSVMMRVNVGVNTRNL